MLRSKLDSWLSVKADQGIRRVSFSGYVLNFVQLYNGTYKIITLKLKSKVFS